MPFAPVGTRNHDQNEWQPTQPDYLATLKRHPHHSWLDLHLTHLPIDGDNFQKAHSLIVLKQNRLQLINLKNVIKWSGNNNMKTLICNQKRVLWFRYLRNWFHAFTRILIFYHVPLSVKWLARFLISFWNRNARLRNVSLAIKRTNKRWFMLVSFFKWKALPFFHLWRARNRSIC